MVKMMVSSSHDNLSQYSNTRYPTGTMPSNTGQCTYYVGYKVLLCLSNEYYYVVNPVSFSEYLHENHKTCL